VERFTAFHETTPLKVGDIMKKIIASLFCVAMLAAPGFSQATNDSAQAGKSCCASQVADKAATKSAKASCDMQAKASCDMQAKAEKSSCCDSKAETVSKADCKQSCSVADTWMTEPNKCKACETASL
jgi:hypothetical protein